MNPSPTVAACLTPPGSGAIATIAIHGPEALKIALKLFRARRAASVEPQAALPCLGRFGEDTADEVVLIVKQTEPVPCVEIHCHGGREVVRLILQTLEEQGVRGQTWPEFARLTSATPVQAEARIMLAQAKTVRTAAILLDQYQGAFERAVREVLAASEAREDEKACRLLAELAQRIPVGRHLVEPWRVVVAGEPNVGKSSLVNALAGFQRSIVSAIPGTTRDLVSAAIAIDGWPIELLDTAGLRVEGLGLEEQGIRLAQSAIASSDLCLWLCDGSRATAREDSFRPDPARAALLVINKIDLPAAWEHAQAPGAVRVSAKEGAGLAELCQALAGRLVPRPPAPGSAVPFTPHLQQLIEKAWQASQAGDQDGIRRLLDMGSPQHK